jgi:hypothetical protein
VQSEIDETSLASGKAVIAVNHRWRMFGTTFKLLLHGMRIIGVVLMLISVGFLLSVFNPDIIVICNPRESCVVL